MTLASFLAIMGWDDALIFTAISLAMAATCMVLSEFLRPKIGVESARPASLGDFSFPTAEQGRVIPILWGTVKIAGPNVVWYGDFRQEAMSKKVKTGLWSSETMVLGYHYFLGLQMALCRGPVDNFRRIWISDKVLWGPFPGPYADGPILIADDKLFGGDKFGSGGMHGTGYLYSGAAGQTLDAMDYLYNFQSPLPNYRGTCFVTYNGGWVGNSTQIAPWAFEISRWPNSLGIAGGKHIINTYDSNPIAVLYEILTDTDWGFGFDPSLIDIANFKTAADTLYTEGNGMSLILDTPKEASEVLGEIQRQMDGTLYLDHITGQFKIALARGGYNINTVPQLDSTNVMEISNFSRGTWDETINQVRIAFSSRALDYQDTFAQAADLANQRIQLGALISTQLTYPGVKNETLAANIASRQLRYLSTPLAAATIVVDRSMWQLKPGDVVAWTDAGLGFSKMPMRVGRVDFGKMNDGRISLSLTQDIFQFAQPFDGENGSTSWVPPTQGVTAFPPTQQVIEEAPYALTRRDVDYPGVVDRLFTAGRSQAGGEASYKIYQRNAVGAPSGIWIDSGEVFSFMLVGALRSALHDEDANPTTTFDVDATPDTVDDIIAAFTPDPTASDMGQNLVNLVLCGTEFMLVKTVVNHTSYVSFQTVYRGVLDTVPQEHAIADPIYLVCAGAGLSDVAIPRGYNVQGQIRPKSRDNEVTSVQATTVALTMLDRVRCPYPPVEMYLNAVRYGTPVSLDTMKAGGTTDDDRGVVVTFRRRDYRTYDEVQGLGADASTFAADFPAANTTEYSASIIKDPLGSPSLIEASSYANVTSVFFSRTKILGANLGAIPTILRSEVSSQHTLQSEVFTSLQALGYTFAIAASELDNDQNMGVLAQNQVGVGYTAPVNGTYAFSVGPVMGAGAAIEAQVNGGGWTPIITAGNRTGNLAGIIAADTIEVRSTQATTGASETFLRVDAPGTTVDAYAIILL